jgi:4-oxalocrotonate tautomerase
MSGALDHEFRSIAAVMQDYFDGLHHSDTTRLARVFHPQAQYACATEGTLLYRTMEEYFPVVDARPSPASRGEARTDRILGVDFHGPVTARVLAACRIAEKDFIDCLTLLKLEGRWQVISKVFHYETQEAA